MSKDEVLKYHSAPHLECKKMSTACQRNFWCIFCSVIIFQDEKIKEIHNLMEMDDEGIDVKFKQLFEYIQHGKIKSNRLQPRQFLFLPIHFKLNIFCFFDVYQKLIIQLRR